MISRLVTVAALTAGAALLCVPAQAQTGATPGTSPGTTQQDTIQKGGADTTGMGAQGTMRGQGTKDRQQAAGPGGRMRGGEAAERQMTECLNSAAAQQRPLSTCQQMR